MFSVIYAACRCWERKDTWNKYHVSIVSIVINDVGDFNVVGFAYENVDGG